MKINVTNFTQTLSALLNSSLTLQTSLMICRDVLRKKEEKRVCAELVNEINKGNLLSKALNKYELIDSYLNTLSMFQTKSNIVVSDKHKTYIELIKAILMRMLFEDIYLLKGEFCTISIPDHNDKSTNEEEGTPNKKKKVGELKCSSNN